MGEVNRDGVEGGRKTRPRKTQLTGDEGFNVGTNTKSARYSSNIQPINFAVLRRPHPSIWDVSSRGSGLSISGFE
jgi:hypothetical protein